MAMTSWGPMTVLEDERRMWPEALQTVFCDALASAGPPPPPRAQKTVAFGLQRRGAGGGGA